jgi:hypothetical protein
MRKQIPIPIVCFKDDLKPSEITVTLQGIWQTALSHCNKGELNLTSRDSQSSWHQTQSQAAENKNTKKFSRTKEENQHTKGQCTPVRTYKNIHEASSTDFNQLSLPHLKQ